MALELSSIEGLTPEQIEAINAAHSASIDIEVSGLKAKNAELIQREKDAKEKAEAQERAKAEAEEQAQIELAAKNKDFEGYQKAIADRDARIAEYEAEKKAFADSQLMDSARKEFMQGVSDDPAAQHYMTHLFNSNVAVKEGQVMPVNADGGFTGQSLSDLIGSIKADPANAAYIKSPAGSGGSANGSGDTKGGTADFSKMTKTEQSVYLNKHPEKAAQLLHS